MKPVIWSREECWVWWRLCYLSSAGCSVDCFVAHCEIWWEESSVHLFNPTFHPLPCTFFHLLKKYIYSVQGRPFGFCPELSSSLFYLFTARFGTELYYFLWLLEFCNSCKLSNPLHTSPYTQNKMNTFCLFFDNSKFKIKIFCFKIIITTAMTLSDVWWNDLCSTRSPVCSTGRSLVYSSTDPWKWSFCPCQRMKMSSLVCFGSRTSQGWAILTPKILPRKLQTLVVFVCHCNEDSVLKRTNNLLEMY